MNIKETKASGLEYEFEITIPANDIDRHVDERLAEVGKTIKMPGFRAGKIPMKLLKQKYGKAVMGEVLEKAVNESSAKALAEKNLRPAMQPKIEVKSFDDGKDLVYAMNVQVLPEIKIADMKGQKFTKNIAKVGDKEIANALEKIAANNSTTQKVETARGAKDGDTLVIDFDGRTADDDKKHPGMQANGHYLKLGSGQFIPGFEDQLLKAKAGDKVEVKVSFPREYGAKELAGRDAIFDVNVHEIREDAEAKIDDELAKSLGLDDLAALKKAIEEQLSKELDGMSRTAMKKEILDFIDDKHKFEIPAAMLDMEYQNIADQIKLEKQRRGENKPELSKDEENEYRYIADRRVRLGLVLAEIGNKNKLIVSDPELQKAVIMEAQKYPGQEKAVFDYYSKNRNALESLRAPLYEEKVVDFIIAQAEITEKSVSSDELMKLIEGDDEAEDKPKAKKSSSTSKEKSEEGEKKAPAKKKPAAKK